MKDALVLASPLFGILAVALVSLVVGWSLARPGRGDRKAPGSAALLAALGVAGVTCGVALRLLASQRGGVEPPALLLVAGAFAALGFLVVGVLAALAAREPPSCSRIAVATAAMAVLILAGWDAVGHFGTGLRVRGLDGPVSDGVVMQSRSWSCVPAALASVLRWWGEDVTEGEVALALGAVPLRGTDFDAVPSRAGRLPTRRAFAVRRGTTTLEEIERHGRPAVLRVWAGDVPHAVALLAVEGDALLVGDPLRGLVRVQRASFSASTRWRGDALLIEPNATRGAGDASGR